MKTSSNNAVVPPRKHPAAASNEAGSNTKTSNQAGRTDLLHPDVQPVQATDIPCSSQLPERLAALVDAGLRYERHILREMFRGVVRLDGSIDYERLAAFQGALGQHEPEARVKLSSLNVVHV